MKVPFSQPKHIRLWMIVTLLTGTSSSFSPVRVVTKPTTIMFSTRRKSAETKGKGAKWQRRRGKNGGDSQFRRAKPAPRPVLTKYSASRNPETNEERLRGSIGCEHFGTCPGCVKDGQVAEVDVVRSAKRFFASTAIRKNRIDVLSSGEDWVVEGEDDGFLQVVVPSEVTNWRTQAKLVVAPKSSTWSKDGCTFGLYKRGTHQVMPIPTCTVHHPSINRAVAVLEKATRNVGTAAHSEETREGGLRYVQLQIERTTGKCCLTLVWAASSVKYAQPGLSRLAKELGKLDPDLWHSMWCHCNDSLGNSIFTRNTGNWHRLSGLEFVREPIAIGTYGWLYFSPLAFRQGNIDGFDIIANDVARAVPPGSKVCELYAGVGLLGLTALAYHGQSVGDQLTWLRCSDENPANLRCFTRSLRSLPTEVTDHGGGKRQQGTSSTMTLGELMRRMESGEEPREDDRVGSKATYSVANAVDALRSGQALGADVLIVDPPRRGLEEAVLDELCKPYNPNQPCVESASILTIPDAAVNWVNDVQTLVYVSCGFDALSRDLESLLSGQGGWKLMSATGFILFPGSNHVETLCVLKRG